MANNKNLFWWQGIISFCLLWQAALCDSDSKVLPAHLQQHATNSTLTLSKVASEEQIEGKMSHGGRLAIAALGEKDSDGRSVYVSSSQYGGTGGSINNHDATPPPLYQLLQQQMEEVLAATGSDFKPFPMQNNKKYKVKDVEDGVAQVPPKKPLFTFHSDDSDDYADETEGEADLDTDTDNGGYGIVPLLSNRPTPATTRRTTSPTIATGLTKITTTNKPIGNAYNVQQSSKNDLNTAEISKNATTNILHKHKRRITFKTVSTSSQFVSTPLADLMLKFSIGIAKPSNPHSEQQDCNSSDSAEAQTNATEMPRNQSPITNVATKHNKHIKNRKPKVINF